jgi:hypothetical protein
MKLNSRMIRYLMTGLVTTMGLIEAAWIHLDKNFCLIKSNWKYSNLSGKI